MIEAVGLVDLEFGPIIDTFGGAAGEANARTFGTWGRPIRAWKP